MMRIGIVGENFQNDACAFKAIMTPQYKGQVEFVPIGNTLNGKIFATKKVLSTIPTLVKVKNLDAVLFVCDLDNESKRRERYQWFSTIQKNVHFKSILFIAVMELEALILADIETFNKIYEVSIQYTKNPKFEKDPKGFLMEKTEKPKSKRKYEEKHAFEIFSNLRFDTVYKKHKETDSFQAFIDHFEAEFKINPTTKERLDKTRGKTR
jgi:hypothetical protein